VNLAMRAHEPVAPSNNDAIKVEGLCIGFAVEKRGWLTTRANGTRIIAKQVTFELKVGQSLVILGPNGAGKTTLLRTLLGLIPALRGTVTVGDVNLLHCNPKQRARLLGYVPQSQRFGFGFCVRDLVAMGRAPFLPAFALPSKRDLALADASLERLGILHLAKVSATEMSGGEQRLMLIARALVQQSPFLLLDEPTANLDFGNQARVLRHLDALSRSGLGIIMNSHSPGHAFACGTSAAFLDRKGQFEVGNIVEMVTEERLSAVYGIPVRIVTVQADEGPMQTCVPEVKSR
jgi:iron complex transport system ATP-binding protein